MPDDPGSDDPGSDDDEVDVQYYAAGPPTSSGYTSDMEQEEINEDFVDEIEEDDQPRPARYVIQYSSPSPEAQDMHINDLTSIDDLQEGEDPSVEAVVTGTGKQPRSPSTDDEKLPPTPKAVKIVDHSGRARQQDYDTVVKEVIKIAIDLYEVKLITVCGFPSSSMEVDWVTEVWAEACRREGVKYRITSDLHKMLTRRGTHLRSEMKNKGRKTVTIYYNLKPGQSERSKTTNKKLVGKLLMQEEPDRNLFVYLAKEQTRESATRQHIYRHPAIANIINEYIFGDRSSLGV
ncbi:hypothetical protein EW026_g8469, partial [Hermanssonia centrifuga]